MRRALRWLGRLGLALLLLLVLLLAPVAYVEVACRGTPVADGYVPLLPPEDRRPEARTLLTYPEWHIVHAYEDYAAVIARGDPHDYRFLPEIVGFWSSACALTRVAAAHGGVDGATRRMVHVIGVSFTAELLLKALYEETLGRVATWVRGPARAPLDDLSARQAAAYAAFLRQTPWYRWDFGADAAALSAADTGAFRDRERDLALGVEYRAKALYARAIAAAVAGVGADELTLRSVVAGLAPEALAALPGVEVVGTMPQGVVVETPRYAAFTDLARAIAAQGGRFVEIAGNDDILVTALGPQGAAPGALASVPLQGREGVRYLLLLKVPDLAALLADPPPGIEVEHVHDY